MIIGDSLHSDIQGGQQAKIQTVWLNPTSAPATPTIQPNYTIQQLDELLPILGIKERGTKITLDFCSTLKTDKRREQNQLLRK